MERMTIGKYAIFLRVNQPGNCNELFLFFLARRLLRSFPCFVKEKERKRKEEEEEERKKGRGRGREGRVEVGKTRNAGLKEEKCTTPCVDFIFHASHVSS